jgi:hypothetical protein
VRLPTPLKIFLTIIALVCIAAALEAFVRRKLVVHILAGLGAPSYERVHRRLAITNVARRYRPVAYNGATSQDAGRAYQALLRWEGDDARSPLVVHLPGGMSQEIGRPLESNPLQVPPKRWYKELIPLAAKGLSSNQLRYLRKVTANPDYKLFQTFARARDSDILGLRYTFVQPQRDLIFFRTLPVARRSSVERAFQTSFARAALELSERRPEAAEATLREAANGGLLMVNNGELMDAIAGSVWAKMSLLALADLFEATGRGTEAATIRHDVEAASIEPLPPSLTRKGLDVHDIRDALPSVAARADIAPGLKWEYLVSVQTFNVIAFCIHDWTFDDDYETWRADLRHHMVRRASDARFFDWITDPPKSRTNCPGSVDSGAGETDSLHRALERRT